VNESQARYRELIQEYMRSTLNSTEFGTYSLDFDLIIKLTRERMSAIDAELLDDYVRHESVVSGAEDARRDLVAQQRSAAVLCVAVGIIGLLGISAWIAGGSSGLSQVITVIATLTSAGMAWRYRSIRPSFSSLEQQVKAANATFTARVRGEVEAQVRQVINSPRVSGDDRKRRLEVLEAPALVELDSSDTINAGSVNEIEDFILNHETSTIGIAGPRGAGKTTVLRRICGPGVPDRIGVYIQAPVYYDAADFVRLIHREVCLAIRRSSGGQALPSKYGELHSAATKIIFGMLLITLGCGLLVLDIQNAPILDSLSLISILGLVAASLGSVPVLAALRGPLTQNRRLPLSPSPVLLATNQLRRLNYQHTTTTTANVQAKLSWLTLGSQHEQTLSDRELTHPERVGEFRNFLMEYHHSDGALPIVIGIDELDKIADGAQAIELINSLKDLFHIRNTHFVVSVSQDALISFALRGVPVRDVFDSSFDQVIRIKPFTPVDSAELLSRRVIRFPTSAALLCHVVSGGLPRELIRAARSCVELRRGRAEPPRVDEVAERLVRDELLDILSAFLLRLPEGQCPKSNTRVAQVVSHITEASHLRLDDFDYLSGSEVAPIASVIRSDGAVPIEMIAVIATFVTVSELFCWALQKDNWEQELNSANTSGALQDLAACRNLVSISPGGTITKVLSIRARATLPAAFSGFAERTHYSITSAS
jgi:hypothetical protein